MAMDVCSCVRDGLLAWHHHCFTKWLLPAWPGTLGEMPGCTSSLALSQEVGDKVGSDPPPSKAVGQERVQYRRREGSLQEPLVLSCKSGRPLLEELGERGRSPSLGWV